MDILPKNIYVNYLPVGADPGMKEGLGIDETPKENSAPIPKPINWDEIQSPNKPEDNADVTLTSDSKKYLKISTIFEYITNRFSVGGGGTYAISNDRYGLSILSGATANSYGNLFIDTSGTLDDFFVNTLFTTTVTIKTIGTVEAGNNGSFYVGVGFPDFSGTAVDYTISHYGFKYVKVNGVVTLFATSADGTTNEETSIKTISNFDTDNLCAVNTSSGVKFYVDNVLVATHTTNTPASVGSSTVGQIAISNLNTAYDYNFSVSSYTYEQSIGIG